MLRKFTGALSAAIMVLAGSASAKDMTPTQRIIKSRLLMSGFIQTCVDNEADIKKVKDVAIEKGWEDIAPYYRKTELPGFRTDYLWQARVTGGSGYEVPYAMFVKDTETSRICGIQVQQLPSSYLSVALEKAKMAETTKAGDEIRTFCMNTYPGNTKGHEILFRTDPKTRMTLIRAEFSKDGAVKRCPLPDRAGNDLPEFLTVGAVDW